MTIEQTIEQAKVILSHIVITISEQPITIGDILFIPIIIFMGILLTKWLIKLISSRLTTKKTDPNIIHLVERVLYVIAITIIMISILDFMNVPIAAFAFLSGAIAIGFGFGAQNIINNFISGWILMWERPIRIGDFLEIEDSKGLVEEINTRSTRIKRVDGVHLLIPNSKLLENTVVNWTLVDQFVRCSVKVGVAYGSPAKKVAGLIMQATTEQAEALTEPKPLVTFDDFGDNALMFEVTFWVNSRVESGLRIAKSNVRFRLEELFEQENIVVAYPQRDIHLDGSLKIINS
ncbi:MULTISPECIES: mechanosensitive ion channel family protein [unclassified Colwellia]|uniref:mechanosensitive ion channel family protein n=1 Tax=unclassified Colwellia TaxID=196834 RepID=UPI0015F4D13A|nr:MULTISPECIES: mechanosensitive ion channel domain-containing protein [unclassified Colwellia]MBA6224915.1 mechanosensitive ion channel [Colwellia sp. MB3u-45]MBA6268797.1 mechanosensitive ion channel [Colwellia sp. MB3u-43]MBA6287457.1 mechanosensitive ion channel [Colwellia sp. MB3u-4]MBA6296286.1 mechanosensitive ion channel [Colwellia sp. MB02u-9]MBA6321228.1 mechanosensitive ion channel [Colwellia sp. MB02u-19]